MRSSISLASKWIRLYKKIHNFLICSYDEKKPLARHTSLFLGCIVLYNNSRLANKLHDIAPWSLSLRFTAYLPLHKMFKVSLYYVR